jgi:hypothetical protein
MTFSHPREAMQLEGIGEVIAKKLEERMIKYCRDNGLPPPTKKRSEFYKCHSLSK